MNFTDLESIMYKKGVKSLAEIARALDTTPQAVSNWKARNQIPYHIIAKVNNNKEIDTNISQNEKTDSSILPIQRGSFSDFLVILAEQLKVIVLVTFITVFLSFVYARFIEKPVYYSWATILLPENNISNLGGLSSLATQFGVNIPSSNEADLSSPSLYPELLRSRTFSEKLLKKELYSKEFGKRLPLLNILINDSKNRIIEDEYLISQAISRLNNMISFNSDPTSNFSTIGASTSEPIFSKELVEAALSELENLNRYFKSQKTTEKINFINNRINSVENELNVSELRLKEFNEKNRQASSPALKLELDRLTREMDIQKGIFLTLKQQLELAKIEEIQEASIVQVLDMPKIPFSSSNRSLKITIIFSGIFGVFFGIGIGSIRSYSNSSDISERKKLNRFKYLLRKKWKAMFNDSRFVGIICSLLILGLPFFLNYRSASPIFLGRYSLKVMIMNIFYIIFLLFFAFVYYSIRKKSSNQ